MLILNMLPRPRSRSADVLYLDFDGVLHPEDVYGGRGLRTRLGRQHGAGRQLFEHAELLASLLGPYEPVRIVLSTSWVPIKGYSYAVKQLPASLKARCCGATWHKRMLPYAPIWDQLPRGQQVLEDVKRRQPERWLAVDDDAQGWSPFESQLVVSDKLHGISLPRVREELEWKLACTFGDKPEVQET